MKYDINLRYGNENDFGDQTLYVFTEDRKLGLSCHRDLGQLVFYLHDFTTNEISFRGEIKSTKTMMKEFDRFILWHHRKDLANNPFFQKSET